MDYPKVYRAPWTRKHDDPRTPHIPSAPVIVYPQSLEHLVDLCKHRPTGVRYKAAGSHWALSEAAISDNTFIETHDPRNAYPALDKTLNTVIPSCLTNQYLKYLADQAVIMERKETFLVHVEAGKRIFIAFAIPCSKNRSASSLLP